MPPENLLVPVTPVPHVAVSHLRGGGRWDRETHICQDQLNLSLIDPKQFQSQSCEGNNMTSKLTYHVS